jgi:hypothetical protein
MARLELQPWRQLPELFPDPLDRLTNLLILVVVLRLLSGC